MEEGSSDTESEDCLGKIREDKVGKLAMDTRDTVVGVSALQDSELQNETMLKMETDTGCNKTILSKNDWEKVKGGAVLKRTVRKFRPYGTVATLPVMGKATVRLRARAGATIKTTVFVNDGKENSLLGKSDAIRLGVVVIDTRGKEQEVMTEQCNRIKSNTKTELIKERSKINQKKVDKEMKDLAEEYKDIMTGIGKYKGPPVKIQMAEDIKPVIQPPRRIPLHYIQPLKDHLKEMVEEEVIEGPLQEEEEGSWISNLVITDKKWDDEAKKEGQRIQIRANLDCRPINKHVYQTREPMPTPEEVRHKLRGSNRFLTLDMIHSFHQFILEKSAM